jgi:hypothetical protein
VAADARLRSETEIPLLTLARLALWGGDLRVAEERDRESLAICAPLDDRLSVVGCLEVLAEAAAAGEQPARVARRFEAAAAERAAIGVPAAPVERDLHARLRAARAERTGQVAGIEAVVADELGHPRTRVLGRRS